MFIFAAAVQGAATRYRGGETGGVGGAAGGAKRPCRAGAKGPRPARLAAGGRQTPPPPRQRQVPTAAK